MTDNLSDNELIAEFMGYRIGSDGVLSEYYQVPNHPPMYGIPAFHADWSLLMPVVEKIEEILLQVRIDTAFVNICGEYEGKKYNQDTCFEKQSDQKIDVTYRAVLACIKFLNETKPV